MRILRLLLLPALVTGSDAFIRGDVNQDGSVGIPDLVMLSAAIRQAEQDPGRFLGDMSFTLRCPDAADVDDDGAITPADREAFESGFFAGDGPSLPAPFPVRGFDPTPDALAAAGVGRPFVAAEVRGRVGVREKDEDGLFPPGGGSDLQYIHFACAEIVLEPGAEIRIPVVVQTRRPLAGLSFAVRYDPGLFSRVDLDFDNAAPLLSGGRVWQLSAFRDQGRLAAACLFHHEPVGPAWSVLTAAYLNLAVDRGVRTGTSTAISFEELAVPGDAAVAWILNEVADVGGNAYDLLERSRSLEILFSEQPAFVRGELDRSGAIDTADAVHLLRYLFAGGPAPRCPDAADVDDSGSVGLSDTLHLLRYLWTGDPLPRAPFPQAGVDPSPDRLGPCEAQPLGLIANK